MFSANVSWDHEDRETVGQRKERKDKKRAQSVKSAASKSRDVSARTSESSNREHQAAPRRPLRKASKAQSLNSHPIYVEEARTRNDSIPPVPQRTDKYIETQKVLRTPDLFIEQFPKDSTRPSEDDDLMTRRRGLHKYSLPSLTCSHTPRSSQETELSRDAREEVMDHLCEIQQLPSGGGFVSRTTTRSSEVRTPEECSPRMMPVDASKDRLEAYDKASYTVQIRSRYSPEDGNQDLTWGYVPAMDVKPMQLTVTTLDNWRAPNNWDVVPPTPTSPSETSVARSSDSAHRGNFTSVEANTGGLTHFQRFIRRMQQGSPKIILDRLNEDWSPPTTEEERDNLALEKYLWVLAAFQLKKQGSEGHIPDNDMLQRGQQCGDLKRRYVLEMYGNLAEVYQLSAMNPYDNIRYLSTRQQSTVPLPCNVSYLTVPHAGMTPLPYPSESFDRVRTSCLPSLIPLTKLPLILRECSRILLPAGVLEIRIIAPSPREDTIGPKMTEWMNDRLLIGLERSFRSLRPGLSMPKWLDDAGLVVQQPTQVLRLPAASDPAVKDVDDELATQVARSMWADAWGQHIEDRPGRHRWWWQDDDLVQECVQYGTVIEFETLLASKPS